MQISPLVFYIGIEIIAILSLVCLILSYFLFKAKQAQSNILKEICDSPIERPSSLKNFFKLFSCEPSVNKISELKSVSLEQKQTINMMQLQVDQLSQQLEDTDSSQDFIEEQNKVIKNHEKTIDKLQGELECKSLRVNELQATLNKNDLIAGSEEDLRTIIQRFTLETKELMSCIYTLEKENESLKTKLNMATFETS